MNCMLDNSKKVLICQMGRDVIALEHESQRFVGYFFPRHPAKIRIKFHK